MSKAIVLLSGGQDSTTCLFWAKQNFDLVDAVSINYGQRHVVELQQAERIAELAGVHAWDVVPLPFGSMLGGKSALVDKTKPIEAQGGFVDKEMPQGLPTSFVPGRNLLFLALIGAIAATRGIHDIVTGVCETDYSGYPDCRQSFLDAMRVALEQAMPSSAWPMRIIAPLMWLSKAETVLLARRLPGAWEALAHTVTCYEGQCPGCGECPACVVRERGFRQAGYADPAGYRSA